MDYLKKYTIKGSFFTLGIGVGLYLFNKHLSDINYNLQAFDEAFIKYNPTFDIKEVIYY
jgi:hypothetical protein